MIDEIFVNNPTKYELIGNVKEFEEIQLEVKNLENDSITMDTIGCLVAIRFDKYGREKNVSYCTSQIKFEYYCEFDSLKNEIHQISSNSKNILKLDPSGNVIERKRSVRDSTFLGKWVYKYDNKNNQIERIGFLGEDFIERWKHVYNINNNRIEEIMIDEKSDSIVYLRRVFNYDILNNIVQQEFWNQGDTICSHLDLFGYDSYGNLTEWKRTSDSDLLEFEEYSYIYDEKGNWIEKKVFSSSVLNRIIERRITYYD